MSHSGAHRREARPRRHGLERTGHTLPAKLQGPLAEERKPSPDKYVYLPEEIIEIIAEQARRLDVYGQFTLACCCRVNKTWCRIFTVKLYNAPKFRKHGSFEMFVATVAPLARVRSHPVLELPHGDMVEQLQLSTFTHNRSRAVTARLISRCKSKLRVFRSPYAAPGQNAFGQNCWLALGKCTQLEVLDLHAVKIDGRDEEPLQTLLQQLPKLRELHMPSALLWCNPVRLPPLVDDLRLTGWEAFDGLLFQILRGLNDRYNQNINQLSITHDPLAFRDPYNLELHCIPLVREFSRTLVELRLYKLHAVGRFSLLIAGATDFCPSLQKLAIQQDLWFGEGGLELACCHPADTPPAHPLRHLALWPSIMPARVNNDTQSSLSIGEFTNVLKRHTLFANLRSVTVIHGMLWHYHEEDLDDLDSFLEERAAANGWDVRAAGAWFGRGS